MKKIAYILAAAFAVATLSVTSFAAGLVEDAQDAVDTVADDLEDALGGSDTSDTEAEPPAADTSDTEADDPAESSDTSETPADTSDKPEESSDTSDTQPDVSSQSDVTTTAPTNVGNTGNTNKNPATGVVLGFTTLGLAAAGITAAAARKRK